MVLSTEKIVVVYNLLNTAKINKMDDSSKFALIKAIRKMKPVATSFVEFREDAQTRLRDDKFEEMQKKAQEWHKAEEENADIPFTMEERIAINTYFNEYANKVNTCLKEEAGKENDLDIPYFSEDAFNGLIVSNEEWTVEQMVLLSEVLVKD